MSGDRLTPEDFFGLLCDYVRADGWEQLPDGRWKRPDEEEPASSPVALLLAVGRTMRHDNLDVLAPAPEQWTSFGPTRQAAS